MNNGYSAQRLGNIAKGLLNGGTAQTIADNVQGNSSRNIDPNTNDMATILKGMLQCLLDLRNRLAPEQRLTPIYINGLASGASLPLSQGVGLNGASYNAIVGTCQNKGATVDVWLNSASPNGAPDFSFVGGNGTSQFFFPSMGISQIYVKNSGVTIANGRIDMMQY